MEIEPRTARHDRGLAPAEDLIDRLKRELLVLRSGQIVFRLRDAVEMVRKRVHLLRCRLGAADIHVFVELDRIAVDDFAAQTLSEVKRDGALADGGRSRDDVYGIVITCHDFS